MNDRPSHKELTKKLRDAQAILTRSGFLAADARKLGNDFQALKCYTPEEQGDALGAAFSEVTARDYRGRRPPETSFEKTTHGREMLTFIWSSEYFGQEMYLKFCLHEPDQHEETVLYVFSLHVDRPRVPRRGQN